MFNQNFGELKGGMKGIAVIISLLMVVVGVMMMFIVNDVFSVGLVFFGALIVVGLFQILKYFAMKDARNGWDIIGGIINIALGIFMIVSSPETRFYGMYIVELFVAVWAIFSGFIHIFGIFGKKKEGQSRVLNAIFGVLLLIAGILLLVYPLWGTVGLIRWGRIFASVALVIGGFSGLAFALSGKKAIQDAVGELTEEKPAEEAGE